MVVDRFCPFGVLGPGTVCSEGYPKLAYGNTDIRCRAWQHREEMYFGRTISREGCKRLGDV
jgi:hypothetical protein